MQTRRDLLSVLAAAPFLLVLGRAAHSQGSVREGTVVPLTFRRDVSTTIAKKGDLIPLIVDRDIRVNGKRIFRKGEEVTGEVFAVDAPGKFGERGQIRIRLRSVKSVEGGRFDLAPYQLTHRAPMEIDERGLVAFEPSGLVEGSLVEGKHVTIEKGTRILAKVTGRSKAPEPTELSDTQAFARERPVSKVNHRRTVDWRDRNIPGHAP